MQHLRRRRQGSLEAERVNGLPKGAKRWLPTHEMQHTGQSRWDPPSWLAGGLCPRPSKSSSPRPLRLPSCMYSASTLLPPPMGSSLPHEASHHVPYLEILEQLKNRLNDRCSDLLAPPAKVGHPRDCHKMLAQEKEHLVEGEAALRTLQEELDRTLEKLDCDRDEAEGLQERIRQLKDIVEEANHRGVQDVPSGCLNLPSLPPDSFLPISLQDRLETLENPARILAELESLGRCGELQDLCTFLERAYAQVDGF
ncbi:centromere protein Q isoform X6 [Narcine bancroftii]|uniref:centromere protein Q isoform X6 n=1 Tax=Narcine bancroftii TaxID=1343680 RepID=UPI003831BC60